MFLVYFMSTINIIITVIIMMISSFLSKKSNSDREKNSPFECGFDPKSNARMPFSLRFFLIAIIFLIFDVEITLLLPMVTIYEKVNMWSWMAVSMLFLTILLLGLYHEWNQGALLWAS
uniref:NADH-ubiquinone oxidoreductase chain 3 n=1 Tax=Pedetontus silvestrii TaxID=518099 RepID=B7SSK9_9INSE|nr:NADH dehydrogenase subunit 3 [Pedetontus silvestrii]ACC60221.1 NADH dehydrogenase subunit 3 [Pedetontus silvestrii]